MKNYQRVFGVFFSLILLFSAELVFAAPDLVIKDYTFISYEKISETEIDVTFQVNIVNSGGDAQNVTASLTSTAPATTVVDGSLTFGNVAAGETKTSENTFTIRQGCNVGSDESSLKWDIEYEQIVGSEGGVVEGDEGVSVEIPPAALDKPVNVTIELIHESDLEIKTPGVCQFVGGAKLDIGGAILKDNAVMSIPCHPGIPTFVEVHLAKVVEYAGTQMYMLQGTGFVKDGAIISQSNTSPRKLTDGTYSFLRTQNNGWVEGVVTRKRDGTHVEGAVVTLNGGNFLDITDSNGKFRLPATSGNLVVVASGKRAAQYGEKQGRLPSKDSTITVNVQIGYNSFAARDEFRNGNFEAGYLSSWTSTGAASAVQSLGPIKPDEGNYMMKISSGAGAGGLSNSIEQTFIVPWGATTMTLRYNLIVKKYLASVDRQYENVFSATLHTPDGSREVAFEGGDSANFKSVSGVPCSSGDCTLWGQTGWTTASLNVAQWAGKNATLTFTVHDVGDTAQAATGLVDAIEFDEEYPAVETWDLLVICSRGLSPSVDEWSSIKENFKRASNMLYDATDGQVNLGTIKFSKNSLIDYYLADFVLTKDSSPGTYTFSQFGSAKGESVRRAYVQLGSNIIPNDEHHAYSAIVHELGHYKFDLGDEYKGAGYTARYCRSQYRSGSIMDMPFHHLLFPRGTSEFCTPNGRTSHHDPRDIAGNPASTEHDDQWGLLGGYISSWEVINKYNNSIKIPTGDPNPGPCSKSIDKYSKKSHEPLEADHGTAKFVVVIGP